MNRKIIIAHHAKMLNTSIAVNCGLFTVDFDLGRPVKPFEAVAIGGLARIFHPFLWVRVDAAFLLICCPPQPCSRRFQLVALTGTTLPPTPVVFQRAGDSTRP